MTEIKPTTAPSTDIEALADKVDIARRGILNIVDRTHLSEQARAQLWAVEQSLYLALEASGVKGLGL